VKLAWFNRYGRDGLAGFTAAMAGHGWQAGLEPHGENLRDGVHALTGIRQHRKKARPLRVRHCLIQWANV
jgi:hypothetical protein